MKTIRITALAEFDLAEAQDFYAPHGAWVLGHFMEAINEAFMELTLTAASIPSTSATTEWACRISRFRCTTMSSATMSL